MPLALFLMLAGLAPLFAGVLLISFGVSPLAGLGAVEPWFKAYGLVIAAFMAGTLWGRADPAGPRESKFALAASNIIALVLWAGAAATTGASYDFLLAAAFIALFAAERRLPAALAYPASYGWARGIVTALVVTCLALHALYDRLAN